MSAQIFASDIDRLHAWRGVLMTFASVLMAEVAATGSTVSITRNRQIMALDRWNGIRNTRRSRRDQAQSALSACEARAAYARDHDDHGDRCVAERAELQRRDQDLREAEAMVSRVQAVGGRISVVEAAASSASAHAALIGGIDIPSTAAKITQAANALSTIHAVPGGSYDSLGLRAAKAAGASAAFRPSMAEVVPASPTPPVIEPQSAATTPTAPKSPPTADHPLAGLLGLAKQRKHDQS